MCSHGNGIGDEVMIEQRDQRVPRDSERFQFLTIIISDAETERVRSGLKIVYIYY